jgi:DNA-binding MarR family transcriptional regulator
MGKAIERRTMQTTAVLLAIEAAGKDASFYGLELASAAGIRRSSVYRILEKLEDLGWLCSREEDIDEQAAGRRRRVYFSLTPLGAEAVSQELAAAHGNREAGRRIRVGKPSDAPA